MGKTAVWLTAVISPFLFTRCESLSKGLDTTFGNSGIVVTSIGTSDDRIYAVGLQTDGKIIAAGSSFTSKLNFALARYNTDGSLDTSFDSDGRKIESMSSGDDIIYALVVMSDGTLFVAGSTTVSSGNTDLIVARFLSNGSLDTSFGTGGKVTKDLGLAAGADAARAMILDNAGRLVVAGVADDGTNLAFALARYTTAGAPDTTFDSDGFQTVAFNTTDTARALVQDNVGRIVVAGRSVGSLALARLRSNGSLDTSFDTNGKKTVAISGGSAFATGVAIRSSGKILLSGVANEGGSSDALLAQFADDGSTDLNFGTNGTALYSVITTASRSDTANALLLGIGDKPVFVGKTNNGSNFDWLLARTRFDGDSDFTFDSDGFFTQDFSTGLDEAHAAVIQNDGKIVVAGEASNGSNADFALLRYEP